jgi:hypothetical protein
LTRAALPLRLAHTIAFDTELAAGQAISMLKASPEAQKVLRLDGHVPAPRIDAMDPTSGASTASADLAAATQRLIEKTYGKAAV